MPGVGNTLRISITRIGPALLFLAMLPAVFGGCATGPNVQAPAAHEPATGEESPQDQTKKQAVARLDDGREGFVITESPQVDGASQKDFERAVSRLEDEDYDEAIVILEKIIEKSPGVTAPYIDLAIAYGLTGRFEQAEENLKSALALFPGHPVACNEYGRLLRRTGRFAEARTMYEMAIARFPDFYPARRNLGILCDLYLSDYSCALEQYEIYSEAMPYDDQVKLWVADLRARLGQGKGE